MAMQKASIKLAAKNRKANDANEEEAERRNMTSGWRPLKEERRKL